MEWEATECQASVRVGCDLMESFKVMDMNVYIMQNTGSNPRYHITFEIAGRDVMLDLNSFDSMDEAKREVEHLLEAIRFGCQRLLEGSGI